MLAVIIFIDGETTITEYLYKIVQSNSKSMNIKEKKLLY